MEILSKYSDSGLMHSRNASPIKQQITTATNEFIRNMKNTSRELPRSHIETIISDYCDDLKRGGYHKNWIQNCVEAAIV